MLGVLTMDQELLDAETSLLIAIVSHFYRDQEGEQMRYIKEGPVEI